MNWIEDLIQKSLIDTYSIQECLSAFRNQFQEESKLILVELVYRILYSDDFLSKNEALFIQTLFKELRLNPNYKSQFDAHFKPKKQNTTDLYSLFGLKPTATKTEIKKAYREACKKHHPDKVQHLGKEFQKIAEEKMKKLNESYDILIKNAT